MNAPFDTYCPQGFDAPKHSAAWPIRWGAAKGTDRENAALMSIAVEASSRGDDEVFVSAYDAALSKDAEERAEHIEALEELFREAGEQECRQGRIYRLECCTGQEFDL